MRVEAALPEVDEVAEVTARIALLRREAVARKLRALGFVFTEDGERTFTFTVHY